MDEETQRNEIEERIIGSIEAILSAKNPVEKEVRVSNAWNRLHTAYSRYIYAIVQEKVWRTDEIDGVCNGIWADARESLRNVPERWKEPRRYLAGIAVKHCLRWRRAAAKREGREASMGDEEAFAEGATASVEEVAIHNATFWEEFAKCFEQLTPAEKAVIQLLYLEYESGEIREKLGIEQSNYNTRASRARKALIPCMKEAGFDMETRKKTTLEGD